jgi:probable phosphoglycerate mutase
MRLILVRHGQTSSNVATLLDTAHPGADLTDLGREQAAALPDALDGTPIDAIYASTLVRTQQTAEPLAAAHGLEVRVRAGLREISAGALEMLGDPDSLDSYLTTALAWGAGDLTPTIPGGEPGDAALERFDEVVAEVAASGAGTVVVVSHGIMIRTWATARSDITPDFAAGSRLANADVVVLDGHPDSGWRALTWGGAPVPGGVPG